MAQTQQNPRFVMDSNGKKEAVILSVAAYEELLEELDDFRTLEERKRSKLIPASQVRARLVKRGKLSR